MDLKHPTTQTPDPENETPFHPHPQSINLLSFSNGKTNHHHHPPPPTVAATTYRECLKNHAATIGGHALDGCGEFMPSPASTATEPASLKCAACGCHRNFHRREPTNDFSTTARNTTHFIEFSRHPHHQPNSTSTSPSPPSPPGPHLLLSLSTAADQNHTVATPGTPMPVPIKIENGGGRKRFRTKFSQDQKEKMLGFAEKVGWKMQRCGDKMVMDFCNEIGIRRGIFKVWMHNNKNTFRKPENATATATATTTTAAAGVVRSDDDSIHQENGNLQASTNGSSSSS